jgi:hypothetical protein
MTQAFNLAQLANNLNTSGQLDATDGLIGVLPVGNGGTGRSTLTANNVLLGNGTTAVQQVAPGSSNNVLTSDGSTWTSQTPQTIGVSQTWQQVVRSQGVVYTNSTGKPIALSIYSANAVNSATRIQIYLNGTQISETGGSYGGQGFSASIIIPNGSNYSWNTDTGGVNPNFAELR